MTPEPPLLLPMEDYNRSNMQSKLSTKQDHQLVCF